MLNETVNQTASSLDPNTFATDFIIQRFGDSFIGDSIIFWFYTAIIFFILYTLTSFSSLPKSIRIIISLSAPIILDLIVSFGTFTFYIPIINSEFTTTRGVLFLTLLDSIFRYKIFSYLAGSFIVPYVEASSTTSENLIVTILSYSYTSIDTVIEFFGLTYIFYGLIGYFEEKLEKQFEYQLPLSVLLALIPITLYTFVISNPIHEGEEVIQTYNGFTAFVASMDIFAITSVILSVIFNFILIYLIILTITEIIMQAYYKVFFSRKDLEWSYDWAGLALMYTLIYSGIFFLHSNYSWYVAFPVLFILSTLKTKASTVAENSRQRKRQSAAEDRLVQKIRNSGEETSTRTNSQSQNTEFSLTNIILAVLIVLLFLSIFYYIFML